MMSFLRWILSTLVAALAIVFALANRESVDLTWSPVHDPLPLPLFAIGLGGALAGFLTGAALGWLRALTLRRETKRLKRRIESLEKDIAALEKRTGLNDAMPEPLPGDYAAQRGFTP